MFEKLCCCGGVEDDDEFIERIVQEYNTADDKKKLKLLHNLTDDKINKLKARGLFDKTKGPQTRDPTSDNPPIRYPTLPQNPQDKGKTAAEYVEGKSSSSDDDGVFYKDGKIYFRGGSSGY
uniref:Uncharacterized protein n=1 Tax=Meloidogyne javanica TaxID=6303 RepID=A0A915LQK4_MELJA